MICPLPKRQRQRPPARRGRGFASVIAVALISLVATTIAVLSVQLAAEARRTHETAIDAGLRQMLIYGEAAARQRLMSVSASKISEGQMSLPDDFGPDARLEITQAPFTGNDDRSITVEASVQGRRLSQTLHYELQGKTARLLSVEMQSPGRVPRPTMGPTPATTTRPSTPRASGAPAPKAVSTTRSAHPAGHR